MREYDSDRVDVRSDTVTQPTAAMRAVMESAKVGDDVLGDDPTVIELQNRLAKMFGKEAALFVASGTMANAIALRTHTVPGDEIVCDKTAHIYKYEGGGYAALCGASISLVEGKGGLMTAEQVKKVAQPALGSFFEFRDRPNVYRASASDKQDEVEVSTELVRKLEETKAAMAKMHGCCALSKDSDFFIFDLPAGMWRGFRARARLRAQT